MKTWLATVSGWFDWRHLGGGNPMKYFCVCVLSMLVIGLASPAIAQTPIVIGPNTVATWDLQSQTGGITLAQFAAFPYTLLVDALPQPGPLTGVTCVNLGPTAPNLSAASCKAPALQPNGVPQGAHTLTLTALINGVATLPSNPYAYISVIIPAPSNFRLQ